MHIVRWQPQRAEIRYLPASRWSIPACRARQFLDRSGALAVFNGGYFDPQNRPLGLLYAKKWIQPQVASGSAFGGMFTLIDDKPALYPIFQISDARYDGLRHADGLKLLIQCGPRLLSQGNVVPGLERDTFTRRTAIGCDESDRVWLLATSLTYAPSFQEFQKYLGAELHLRDAMNLDGGSSTQCAVGRDVDNPGFSPVPFALGIFAKNS